MINQISNPKVPKYDLEERTKEFSKKIILLCKRIPVSAISKPIVNQLIRSGTSVGANYIEANECGSKKDFKHRIIICKKEAKETMYWLDLIKDECGSLIDSVEDLKKESHEFVLIFSSIINKV